MATPVLSVIIPVYNAERSIERTLDSVLPQAGEDAEIILIDDGSCDRSLEICQRLAREDARIKVFSQANGGPGAARNTGLQAARGEYIQFVDSDDTLMPGTISALLDAAAGNDLVIAHFNILLSGQVLDRGYIPDNRALARDDFLHALAKRPGSYYYSALWNKLYRRQILADHQLSFDTALRWGEDFKFNMAYYAHVNRVGFLNKPVYNYRRTLKGQTWRTMFSFSKSCAIKARLYQSLKALYVGHGAYERYRVYIYRYIFNVTLSQ